MSALSYLERSHIGGFVVVLTTRLSQTILVARSGQRDGDFFLLGRTAQGPVSCRVVSGGRSGVPGAAMLLRCRGLQLADQVPGAE